MNAQDYLPELKAINAALIPAPWKDAESHGRDTIWLDIEDADQTEILCAETLYIGQRGTPEHKKSIAFIKALAQLRNLLPGLIESLEGLG